MARRRMIVWSGVSELDRVTPIMVVATYDTRVGVAGGNAKTGGDMIQVYILRSDMNPLDALALGADEPICGTCPFRSVASGGSGVCYVQVGRAPQSIWNAIQRDGTRVDGKGRPTTVGDSVPFDLTAFKGRLVRFGAYGDPAAVPASVWRKIAAVSDGYTGYTHQWRRAPRAFRSWVMASCDSEQDYADAVAKGYRAFWVRPKGSPKPPGVIMCPASAEAGKKRQCADCLMCGGTSSAQARSITIEAHGATAGRFASLPLSVK